MVRRASRAARVIALGVLIGLAACSSAIEWREFRWDDGGFAVVLPAKPTRDRRPVTVDGQSLELTLFRTEPAGAAVAVAYADLPATLDGPARDRLLAGARDALLANIGQAPPGKSAPVTLDGAPGLQFEGEGIPPAGPPRGEPGKTAPLPPRLAIAGRVFATSSRFYQLVMIAPIGHPVLADQSLFLSSLRLLK